MSPCLRKKETGCQKRSLNEERQLMGSPLSFPILRAINYVAYRSALKKYIKDLGGDWTKAEKLEMRVNGDDILFKCNKHFYNDYWKPSVAMIGFTLSPGKNYISSSFLTVNNGSHCPTDDLRKSVTSIRAWSTVVQMAA